MSEEKEKYLVVRKNGEVDTLPLPDIVRLERSGEIQFVRGVDNWEVLQQILIERLAEPTRRFRIKRFCETYRVPEKVVQFWLKDKQINKLVKERVREVIGGGVFLSKLYKVMCAQALAGSFKHQCLLFEITGEYQPGLKLEHDITSPELKFRQLEQERRARLTDGSERNLSETVQEP